MSDGPKSITWDMGRGAEACVVMASGDYAKLRGAVAHNILVSGLRKRITDLEAAVKIVGTPKCTDLHHPPKDRHEAADVCPVVVRYLGLVGRATK